MPHVCLDATRAAPAADTLSRKPDPSLGALHNDGARRCGVLPRSASRSPNRNRTPTPVVRALPGPDCVRFRPAPFRGWCGERRGPNADPVRTVHRARQLRLRVRRGHRRPALACDRARRAHRARQSRAPRRQRLREEHGRRRGHPRHAPLPVPGRCRRDARRHAPARRVRRRDGVPPPRCREPRGVSDEGRGHPAGGGPHAPRLAPGPDRPRGPRRRRPLQPARHRAGVRRPARRPRRRPGRGPRLRAPPVRRAAPDREGRQPLARSPAGTTSTSPR